MTDLSVTVHHSITELKRGEWNALVAQQADTDPAVLPPMHDCIDVDALERLVSERPRTDRNVTIQFRYAGYTVEADRERLAVQQVE